MSISLRSPLTVQPVTPVGSFSPVALAFLSGNPDLTLSDFGLTHLDAQWFSSLWHTLLATKGFQTVNVTRNALPLFDLSNIITFFGQIMTAGEPPDISLQGPKNGVFSCADAQLWSYGTQQDGIISFNCGSGFAIINQQESLADFDQARLAVSQLLGLIMFIYDNYFELAWQLNIAGGCASLTGQPAWVFGKLQQLEESGGWSIYRN